MKSIFVLVMFAGTLLVAACGQTELSEERVATLEAASVAEEASPLPTNIAGPAPPTGEAGPRPFTVIVDVAAARHVISPEIYGLSLAPDAYLEALQPGLHSWGGNPNTRYNWRLGNAWNAGSDWYYRNGNYDTTGQASHGFIAASNDAGTATRFAIPTLGWVAKNDDIDTCSFPKADGTCGDADGADCRNPGLISDPTLTSVRSTPSDVVAMIEDMQEQGLDIDYIAMDNEPELWGFTHYDVHPTCTTYQEILDKFLAYAIPIKEVAPESDITGPVTCCWHFYWNSAAGAPDRQQHGNADFLPWFLDSVRAHDEENGFRTLDVLDIHYYPEGVYNEDADPATAAHRLRSTRSLWDRNYVDESWIDQPIALIPLMKELIDRHYPDTNFGISEWNWGADGTMNGALAIADVLGIFGREDLDFAAYWRYPEIDTPGFQAFKFYTNFDGLGTRFGDLSVQAETDDGDRVAAYAALDSNTGNLHLMLLNKQPDAEQSVQIQLDHFTPHTTGSLYRYQESMDSEITFSSLDEVAQTFVMVLPAYSISLLVLEPEK